MNGEGEKRDIVFHLHLLSDATGETLNAIAKAAAAQFETAKPIEHVHPLVRTKRQLERALAEIERAPGLVLYTLMSPDLRTMLEERLDVLGMPAHSVLDGTISIFRQYLGMEASDRPGGQHELDQRYFARIAALNFTMAHDDGQGRLTIDGADVILVGVSRTSKTPTCIYLANRGYKAANIPLVPDLPLPEVLTEARKPLIVGLVASPERLVQIRRNRLLALHEDTETDYVDLDRVRAEATAARRLFMAQRWPVIDVSRRSIEETAAAIIALLNRRELGEPVIGDGVTGDAEK